MIPRSLRDPAGRRSMLGRLAALTPEHPRRWGRMEPARAVATPGGRPAHTSIITFGSSAFDAADPALSLRKLASGKTTLARQIAAESDAVLRLRTPAGRVSLGKVLPARIFIIVSMLCAGCAGNSTQPSHTPLGQPFDLRSGASAILDGGLTITFDRVASDSRCPMDALCIWAGDAVVAVSISQGAGGSVRRELHTDAAGSEVPYLAYSIKLLALAPYPRSDGQIRPGDYVATLAVARR